MVQQFNDRGFQSLNKTDLHLAFVGVKRFQSIYTHFMVPTGTGNQGKPGKMRRHFPVREKSENFLKTGKVRDFY